MVGPFATFEPLLAKFHATAADVWAVTDTSQFEYHLQSYFLGFPGQILREPPMRRFWRDIRVERSKDDVIWRYEIGLSRLLRRERYAIDVAFPSRHLVPGGKNPAIIGWQRLLDRGFPFVKRELARATRGRSRRRGRCRWSCDADSTSTSPSGCDGGCRDRSIAPGRTMLR